MFQQRAADADAPMTAVQAEVSFAFDRLRDALASAALADPALFDRATAFRAAVIGMADRWASGQPATRRAKA